MLINRKTLISIKFKKTPLFAHALLAKLPTDFDFKNCFYDFDSGKFMKKSELGCNIFAWSDFLSKWILWLHKNKGDMYFWSVTDIIDTARKYKYQSGDVVVNYDDSCLGFFTVVDIDSDNRVSIRKNEESSIIEGMYMMNWRLATNEEKNNI